MNFKFKLETVLKNAFLKEGRIKQKLIESKKKLDNIQEEVNLLHDKLLEQEQSLLTEPLDINHTLIQYAYLDRLKVTIEERKTLLEIHSEEYQKCEVQFLKLIKERKILEKLKDKHRQEFLQELSRREQKFLDEQAVLAFIKG